MVSTPSSRISGSESLTDIMVKMEDFLDSLDLYVYDNWLDGAIVSGPHVSKYWVSMTLMFDFKNMPDPDGSLRLMKHGALVKYKKAKKEDRSMKISTDQASLDSFAANQYGVSDAQGSDTQTPRHLEKLPTKDIWLVEIFIPRKFIDDTYNIDIGTITADEQTQAKLDKEISEPTQDGQPITSTGSEDSGLSEPTGEM